MLRRLAVAGMLAILLIALGVTVRLGDAPSGFDLALFFDLEGELPDARFRIGAHAVPLPLLLVVEGADPERLAGPIPPTILGVELGPVPAEAFFRPELLLAELRPGSQFVETWADTHMTLPIAGGVLYRVAFIVRARDAEGERVLLLIGLGADDPGGRFPAWVRGTHALAIPIERPAGAPRLSARIASPSPALDGDPEDPRSYVERIEIRF
jgi:hypothetical protein